MSKQLQVVECSSVSTLCYEKARFESYCRRVVHQLKTVWPETVCCVDDQIMEQHNYSLLWRFQLVYLNIRLQAYADSGLNNSCPEEYSIWQAPDRFRLCSSWSRTKSPKAIPFFLLWESDQAPWSQLTLHWILSTKDWLCESLTGMMKLTHFSAYH